MIDDLLRDGVEHRSTTESSAWRTGRLGKADIGPAVSEVVSHADASAYLVLMALRRDSADSYREIDAGARAGVLVSALRSLTFLNDFGFLDPAGSFDGPAALALLEAGAAARTLLLEALDDAGPAPLRGSEQAAMAELYGCRRADFAYRYYALLSGREPTFDADALVRDVDLAAARSW